MGRLAQYLGTFWEDHSVVCRWFLSWFMAPLQFVPQCQSGWRRMEILVPVLAIWPWASANGVDGGDAIARAGECQPPMAWSWRRTILVPSKLKPENGGIIFVDLSKHFLPPWSGNWVRLCHSASANDRMPPPKCSAKNTSDRRGKQLRNGWNCWENVY